YWAMSDYTDATVALDWWSDNFTAVTGQFRYNWARQFLQGGLDYRHYWAANGSVQRAFSTRHSWQISERTRFSMDARYASSESFVRQNSFDPREVTQTIQSQGGLNHRFDWGSLNVAANRQQFLSDERVEMTLPSVSLSLNPVTFFRAPPGQGGIFNNITWTGSSSFRRNTRDFADQPLDTTFATARADQVDTRASATSGFSLGNFSVNQNASYNAGTQRGIPDFFLTPGIGPDSDPAARTAAGLPPEVAGVDLTREELSWGAGASYQQRLIGSTTITPRVQVSGRSIRSDTLSVASGFVAAPMRTSFGARLKTDVYGFFPGAGPFEQIRHKISPGFSYDYSPEVTPTDLQRQVFGAGEIQTRSVTSINLNQTFEAKLTQEAEAAAEEQEQADSIARARADSIARAEGLPQQDTLGVDVLGEDQQEGALAGLGQQGGVDQGRRPGQGTAQNLLPDDGLERLETGRTVMLLGLQTSVVTYDFVQADSAGSFIGGFQTTSLNNSVRSDYLQGISLQFTHDLFEVEEPAEGEPALRPGQGRSFSPHLSSMNLSFSLNSSSALFRWLGLSGDGDGGTGAPAGGGAGGQGGGVDAGGQAIDESSIVPGGSGSGAGTGGGVGGGGIGDWRAQFSYSLQRPRIESLSGSQMLQMNFNFQPTQHWDVSWSTAYDLNRRRFNDHAIRLTRDLHRWRANFDFLQTATGNWAFRFSVQLLDNQDLEFDYRQQSPTRRN
ncbi:MAG: putative LPS assembly protein LptD, partial [Longimicrobiales bacterium]|nr:putative LPS assembly protein LptD [Longimicrobiales bacterium]